MLLPLKLKANAPGIIPFSIKSGREMSQFSIGTTFRFDNIIVPTCNLKINFLVIFSLEF